MKLMPAFSIKNRLVSFFFGITLVTIVCIPEFMAHYFEKGLENAAKLSLLTEVNYFARTYKQDRATPLPSSYVFTFKFDDMPSYLIGDKDILSNIQLTEGEFKFLLSDAIRSEGSNKDMVLLIHKHLLDDGRNLYALAQYDLEDNHGYIDKWISKQKYKLLYITSGYLVLVILALWYYSHRVGQKTALLVDWAERVSASLNTETKPALKFDEFNRIASCLEHSLDKNAKLVEREQKFLSHASHELRTPIAIIRANMEILDRINLSDEACEPINRIDRASTNMQLLTETLLWLGRQSESSPAETSVELAGLLQRIVSEQDYLIQDEKVEMRHSFADAPKLVLPVAPLMIVLSNLIRNAFQYTHNGWIKVAYQDGIILIENHDLDLIVDKHVVSFGLGLELTQKVCSKLGWTLEIDKRPGGMQVKLVLPNR